MKGSDLDRKVKERVCVNGFFSLHSLHDDLEQFHNGSLLIHDQSNVALPVGRLTSPCA